MSRLPLFTDVEAPPVGPHCAPSASPGYVASAHDRALATIAAATPTLDVLRSAATGYFLARVEGRTFKRNPAIKITLPVSTEAGERAKLIIFPYANRSWGAAVTVVDPRTLFLSLVGLIPVGDRVRQEGRLTILLKAGEAPRFNAFYPATVDLHAHLICTTASLFVDDPAAAVAKSGTHCAFCGRGLVDPQSKARGIGPECFGHYGDFLRNVVAVPTDRRVTE